MPQLVKKMLEEFEYVMQDEQPKHILLKREVDHKIELVFRTKSLVWTSYQMLQPKLVELSK